MKRTKEWWARLTKQERSMLVWLEKASHHPGYMGGYLPDDCSECAGCGNAMLGSGLCPYCTNDLIDLIKKGDGNEQSEIQKTMEDTIR